MTAAIKPQIAFPGTGGVDDLILTQDYAVATFADDETALVAVVPRAAFELHAAVHLKPATQDATVASILNSLTANPPDVTGALAAIDGGGDFNPGRQGNFDLLMQAIAKLVTIVTPLPNGAAAEAEPSGVPRLRLVQEFHDNSGQARWFFELRMKVLLSPDELTNVQDYLAAGSLSSAVVELNAKTVKKNLDPRVQLDPKAYSDVIGALYP